MTADLFRSLTEKNVRTGFQPHSLCGYRRTDHRDAVGETLADLALHSRPEAQWCGDDTGTLVKQGQLRNPTVYLDTLATQVADLISGIASHYVSDRSGVCAPYHRHDLPSQPHSVITVRMVVETADKHHARSTAYHGRRPVNVVHISQHPNDSVGHEFEQRVPLGLRHGHGDVHAANQSQLHLPQRRRPLMETRCGHRFPTGPVGKR